MRINSTSNCNPISQHIQTRESHSVTGGPFTQNLGNPHNRKISHKSRELSPSGTFDVGAGAEAICGLASLALAPLAAGVVAAGGSGLALPLRVLRLRVLRLRVLPHLRLRGGSDWREQNPTSK